MLTRTHLPFCGSEKEADHCNQAILIRLNEHSFQSDCKYAEPTQLSSITVEQHRIWISERCRPNCALIVDRLSDSEKGFLVGRSWHVLSSWKTRNEKYDTELLCWVPSRAYLVWSVNISPFKQAQRVQHWNPAKIRWSMISLKSGQSYVDGSVGKGDQRQGKPLDYWCHCPVYANFAPWIGYSTVLHSNGLPSRASDGMLPFLQGNYVHVIIRASHSADLCSVGSDRFESLKRSSTGIGLRHRQVRYTAFKLHWKDRHMTRFSWLEGRPRAINFSQWTREWTTHNLIQADLVPSCVASRFSLPHGTPCTSGICTSNDSLATSLTPGWVAYLIEHIRYPTNPLYLAVWSRMMDFRCAFSFCWSETFILRRWRLGSFKPWSSQAACFPPGHSKVGHSEPIKQLTHGWSEFRPRMKECQVSSLHYDTVIPARLESMCLFREEFTKEQQSSVYHDSCSVRGFWEVGSWVQPSYPGQLQWHLM